MNTIEAEAVVLYKNGREVVTNITMSYKGKKQRKGHLMRELTRDIHAEHMDEYRQRSLVKSVRFVMFRGDFLEE